MLELKQIVKDYPAGSATVHALKGVDLRFRTSEFVSILGPSGCGKTTLLNIIGGLDQYTSGDLVIDGVSTKDYKDRDWDTYRNHSIGFVFQTYNLIPHQTVLKNVELALTLAGVAKTERRERAAKALERVGLGDQLNKRPNQMSGGQMQRVAIARALVNNPDIILADEPTGALDTETGLQVMELLKEVAKDRLVVMVTHNPELAEQYSSRIIRILDGVIVGDTAPLTEDEYQAEKTAEIVKQQAESTQNVETVTEETQFADGASESTADVAKSTKKDKKARKKAQKKSSMSFWTAFKLSLTNLFTKKGRTFLTSFAGSIGIIGIALILSVSQGMTTYIGMVQEQTLSTYPLTIQSTSMDLTSLVANMMLEMDSKPEHGNDKVYNRSTIYSVAKAIANSAQKSNDLNAFKAFLESEVAKEDSKLHSAILGLQYQYDLNLLVYTKNVDGEIIPSDAGELMRKVVPEVLGSSTQSSMGGFYGSMGTFSMNIWQEILPGLNGNYVNDLLHDQYDIVYGSWPNEYNEVVLVMNEHNEISDLALYTLGLLGDDLIDNIVNEFNQKGEPVKDVKQSWTYEEICNTECVVILNSSCYTQSSDGIWVDMRQDDLRLSMLYNNGLKLKVTGIIRPNPDATAHMLTGTIGYTSALTEYVVKQSENSEAVKAQKDNATTDIFTGLPFASNKDSLPDEEKAAALRAYINTLNDEEKQEVYIQIKVLDSAETINATADAYLEQQLKDDPELKELKSMMAPYLSDWIYQNYGERMDEETLLAYLDNMDGQRLVEMIRPMLVMMFMQQTSTQISEQLMSLPEENRTALVNSTLTDLTDAQCASYYDDVLTFSEATYQGNLNKLGNVDLDTPSLINIYASSFEAKDVIAEEIARYNSTVDESQRITYTDFVALVMSAVTTIIDAITYVLIAFVSISLIVSSIMIGVITLISVQERTKEIGILRAIGASKRNVSSMFNAETVIIGFAAGLIGVLFTYLLCIPINAILHVLTGISTLNAYLPPLAALILVAISMLLTLISGLIPSRSAAKKDPVVALRTE